MMKGNTNAAFGCKNNRETREEILAIQTGRRKKGKQTFMAFVGLQKVLDNINWSKLFSIGRYKKFKSFAKLVVKLQVE